MLMNQQPSSKEEQEERERLQREDLEKIRAEIKKEKEEQQALGSAKKSEALGLVREARQEDESKPLVSNLDDSARKQIASED